MKHQELTLQLEALKKEVQSSNQEVGIDEEERLLRETCINLMKATEVRNATKLAEYFSLQEKKLQGMKKEEREILEKESEIFKEPKKKTLQGLTQLLQDERTIWGAGKVLVEKQRKKKKVRDCEQQLMAAEHQVDAEKEHFNRLNTKLTSYRTRLECLAHSLRHIKLPKDKVVEVSPDLGEYLLVLKAECEMKLQIQEEQQKSEEKNLGPVKKEIMNRNFGDRTQKKESIRDIHKIYEDQRKLERRNIDVFPDILSREEQKKESEKIVAACSQNGRRKARMMR